MKQPPKNAITQPLRGVDVVITRPSQQAQGMVEQICDLGGVPHIAPVIEIHYRETARVDDVVRNLSRYDVIVVTSANAVRALSAAASRLHVSLPANTRWIAISERTKKIAAEYGITAVTYDGVRTSSDLADRLLEEFQGEAEQSFLVPRGQLSDTKLLETLRQSGLLAEDCICYDTVEHHVPRETWQELLKANRMAILLFSPSAVKSLLKQMGPVPFKQRNILFIVVGQTTKEACETLGLEVAATADHPTADSVMDALVKVLKTGSKKLK